jgi:hypothetical protein
MIKLLGFLLAKTVWFEHTNKAFFASNCRAGDWFNEEMQITVFSFNLLGLPH